MPPKRSSAQALSEWLWQRRHLPAFGGRLPLPSPREALICICALVAISSLTTALGEYLENRPPRRWDNPSEVSAEVPYGVPPPDFQATGANGDPVTLADLPADGLCLVVFLTYRCGACDPALAALDELEASRPTVDVVRVLSDDGPLDLAQGDDWLERKRLEDARLLDTSGQWSSSWIGQRPAFPYAVLLDRGRLIWAVTGIADERTYTQLIDAWDRATQAPEGAEGRLAELRLEEAPGGGETTLLKMVDAGVWVVTYGPADNAGCIQRRRHLSLCRDGTGTPVHQLHIVTGDMPRDRARAEQGLDNGIAAVHKQGVIAKAPAPWVPYTEIWRGREVVWSEDAGDSHRDVVMAALRWVYADSEGW
jgi:hypothetical protein